jgi:hypothetical protein
MSSSRTPHTLTSGRGGPQRALTTHPHVTVDRIEVYAA